MKKIIMAISIIAAMSCTMVFTACKSVEGDGGAVQANGTPVEQTSDAVPAEEASDVSASDITSAIMAEIEIESAVEKTVSDIEAFYDVDTSAIEDMSVFICGSGAYPDELAVFKFKDPDSAKTGAEAVRKRLENQIALYTDYTPDEVYKLEDAVMITKDTWVILTVCSDNSRASEIIEDLI